jgi:hypothetical protein
MPYPCGTFQLILHAVTPYRRRFMAEGRGGLADRPQTGRRGEFRPGTSLTISPRIADSYPVPGGTDVIPSTSILNALPTMLCCLMIAGAD